jgi:hypothetical protein
MLEIWGNPTRLFYLMSVTTTFFLWAVFSTGGKTHARGGGGECGRLLLYTTLVQPSPVPCFHLHPIPTFSWQGYSP